MHQSISGPLDRLALLASDRPRDDRGDVPGWVMVTLMTAAGVGLALAAGSSLGTYLTRPMTRVLWRRAARGHGRIAR